MLTFGQKVLYGQIKGKIYDAISKEAIIGATIKNLSGNDGTFTDQNGVFELKASNISKISIQSNSPSRTLAIASFAFD